MIAIIPLKRDSTAEVYDFGIGNELFENDRWNIKELPCYTNASKKAINSWKNSVGTAFVLKVFELVENEYIKAELKFFFVHRIYDIKISLSTLSSDIVVFNFLARYTSKFCKDIPTILAMDMDEYIKYVGEVNSAKYSAGTRIMESMELKEYTSNSSYITRVRQFRKFIKDCYDDLNHVKEHEKDVWDIRKLPIKVNIDKQRPRYTLSFKGIIQKPIRETVKIYSYERLKTKAFATVQGDLKACNALSLYLGQYKPEITSLGELTRDDMEDFIGYMRTESGLSHHTMCGRLSSLRTMFDYLRMLNIKGAPTTVLLIQSDYSSSIKKIPKYFTDEEIKGLNEHIKDMPLQIGRMLFVIQNVGMRVSELSTLKVDCLSQNSEGDYILTYYQKKVKSYNVVPINETVAKVIKKAIKTSKDEFGEDIEYVFMQTKTRPISTETFSRNLNEITYKYKILDRAGKPLRVKTHEFRGTVATRYINLGLDINIIRMLLGHSSLSSINHYAEILDDTLLDAMEGFIDYSNEMILNRGNVVSAHESIDEDKQLIPLPNGRCERPLSSGICKKANSCYSCVSFIPDIKYLSDYRNHLSKVNTNIEIAKINGFERLLQTNLELKEDVQNIIDKVEVTEGE